jgi:2-polyprenyl-6-methoxyphenol hydroxylase-like FAD-dependent oxidoreductase
MRYTDIAIIGGGLAGSTAAAMLGRAGIAAVLIDPHQAYPFDFRVEKLSGDEQLERFRQTGIAESVLRSATHDGENWIARFGYLLDRKPSRQYGIMYDALIEAIRAEIPGGVEKIYHRRFDQHRAAETQSVQWRGDFRAAGGAGQRPECRAAPPARHRAPDRQRLSFHFDRIRPRSRRPPGL